MPTIADYRSKFPSLRDLDDNALISRVAEVQGVDPEDVIAHMGYKPKPRSLMAVANDTVIEAANATAGAVVRATSLANTSVSSGANLVWNGTETTDVSALVYLRILRTG